MARMIPPDVHPDCASYGEKEIFHRLKNDPQTKDWIVLHSLDLAHHPTQVEGEADFVVVIPNKGVLCLEVKGTGKIRRDASGTWYYGSDPRGDIRGPFKQASAARFAIRNRLLAKRPDLSRVPVWSGVLLPFVDFRTESDEWQPWQVVDGRQFRSRPIGSLLLGMIEAARLHLQSSGAGWFFVTSREPYADQCEAIMETLRPSFEVHENPRSRTMRLEQELKQFTEEQYVALDAMSGNDRVAFIGPAGTGKTLLALEAARRSAEEGRRVLLLCFNRLLGHWLETQIDPLRSRITVGTLHSRMLYVAGVRPSDQVDFWRERLPNAAVNRLLDAGTEEFTYDELIIDEAQDILADPYLDFLDLSLKGGLAAGRWRFFGDFDKQNLYNPSNLSLKDFIDQRSSGTPIYSLRINCRNTPRIAGHAEILAGLTPGYRRYLRPDNMIEPEMLYYASPVQQLELLAQTLGKLYREGVIGDEIVVLSARSDAEAAAKNCRVSPWSDRLKPYENRGKGYIGYCSIHSFKGLEAPTVLVTDISRFSSPEDQELLYVAASRALHRLIILAEEPVRPAIRNVMLQRRFGQ